MTFSDLSWYLSLGLNYLPITRLDRQWMKKYRAPRCFRKLSVHLGWLIRLHSTSKDIQAILAAGMRDVPLGQSGQWLVDLPLLL